MSVRVLAGDCLDLLATLEADSLDACVTDPPYELGFMGRAWDRSGVAFLPDTWRTVFRVLKPGAHLLAFGGTRTSHRMVCAIEDAGFEIRDSLAWLYGSGFPKSLDVSKAIDRAAGAVREVVGLDPQSARRNKTTSKFSGVYGAIDDAASCPLTAPATSEAAAWTGWGTALKPAHEDIILARKPLVGTVAANVLRHGTGAINVDACRVGMNGEVVKTGQGTSDRIYGGGNGLRPAEMGTQAFTSHAQGRWPANVLHDGSDEVEAAFAAFGDAPGQQRYVGPEHGKRDSVNCYGDYGARPPTPPRADTGTASRFFKSCPYSEEEWTAYINASDAAQTIDLQSELAVSALSNAAAQSTPPWVLHSQSYRAPSTSVSVSALRMACASVTAMTQNIALNASLGQRQEKHTLASSLVVCVAILKPTDITTITLDLPTSNGSAANVTFDITPPNMGLGAKDLAQGSRLHYSAKATAADRADSRHPTVKPVDLMRWLVRLVTPPGGTVLDPFAGSGTTGEAAMLEGFNALLMERDPQHAADIRHRIARWSGLDAPLFATTP